MKKYIVIDTWNGEGYSDHNGVDTRIFTDKNKAFDWAYSRALSEANNIEEDVSQYSNKEWWGNAEPYSDGDGYIYEGANGNDGSYQVYELKEDTYAFCILCNINTVSLFTKKQYDETIEDLEWRIENWSKEHKEKEWVTTDIEGLRQIADNGDRYYCEFDDYDYQFRLITNLK